MARKSAAAEVDSAIAGTIPGARLAPLPELSDAESELWRAVVDSKPADWFGRDSAPLLKEYVRAVTMCDRLAVLLQTAAVNRISALLLDRDREARRAANLATKLRLTQQSRYTPQAAGTANKRAGKPRPWENK